MREEIYKFTNRVAKLVGSQSAARLILKVGGNLIKKRFLTSLLELVEEKNSSFDQTWLNRDEETINVGDVRNLEEFLRYPPSFAKHKYVVASEISSATPEAISALLKITEEPPKYAVFIFFTNFPSRVISTIRSRFTILFVKFDPLSLISKDALEKIKDPMIEALVKDSPDAAVYVEKHLKEVEETVSGGKDFASILEIFLNGLKNGVPDFVLSIVAEQLLLEIGKKEIPYVFQKLKYVSDSKSLSRISKLFFNAAFVLVEDIITLKKTAYWKGIKRKPYIPKYLEMNVPTREFVDWMFEVYDANVNQDLSLFLLFSRFALFKRK